MLPVNRQCYANMDHYRQRDSCQAQHLKLHEIVPEALLPRKLRLEYVDPGYLRIHQVLVSRGSTSCHVNRLAARLAMEITSGGTSHFHWIRCYLQNSRH